ncbi:MAG: SGNH/GDSL hydrolase family protein [Oceanospirillaceae bacterium]|nr:SGNH/GDSL hydrolase family protein [Oceanospirillaceae bacterium]
MQDILIYSDSLTWGIIPHTRQRLNFSQRWPGVFETFMNSHGSDIKVLENCLNGRRTVWSDPYKEGRDGSQGFAQVLEMHAPLALVVIMLGTNDFQVTHDNNAWMSAQGMLKLVNIVRSAPIEPGMPVPKIMIVAPPLMQEPKGPLVKKFAGALPRSAGLAAELQAIAEAQHCYFFDAATVTSSSSVDGIHLDLQQHQVLGEAIASALLSFNYFT